jgi:hypothetical protein
MSEIPRLHEWKEIKRSFKLPSGDNILIGPVYPHETDNRSVGLTQRA